MAGGMIVGLWQPGRATAQEAEKGAPLDGAKCHVLWTLASPTGDAITKFKADPYVIDFAMVDTDRETEQSTPMSSGKAAKAAGLGDNN